MAPTPLFPRGVQVISVRKGGLGLGGIRFGLSPSPPSLSLAPPVAAWGLAAAGGVGPGPCWAIVIIP
eukprot:6838587-Pyramimonas_sp.AAC.1